MRFVENRALAWVVLGACALGSVFGLGGAAVAREERAIVRTFYSGAEDRGSDSAMNAYLDRAGENSRIMASEVELYLGASEDTRRMLESAAIADDEGASIEERAAALREMKSLSDALYNAVYGAELTDAQRVNFKSAYDNFWGATRLMEKDPYLELARSYNEEYTDGLAGLAGGLHGADELCESFN